MTVATPAAPLRPLGTKDDEQLITAFFVMYKTARLVAANNRAITLRVAAFRAAMLPFAQQTPTVSIKSIDGRYFLCDRLVRIDDHGLSGAASIVSEWKLLGLGGISMPSDISDETLLQLITSLAAIKPKEENREGLSRQLAGVSIPGVQLLSLREADSGHRQSIEEHKMLRQAARQQFFHAIESVQEVVTGVRNDQSINAAKTRRVVHSLIDHVVRDEASLLELTAIKDFDDYTYAHSVNVCVYSLTIGVRLGLDRGRLSQLGFSALFHDIGKVKLPTDLIRKPDAFDENDWIQMQRHPHLGAKTILRNLSLDLHVARAARGAFEHHINNDFTGYPRLRYHKRPLDLFSKIISIADTFDALSSGRVYMPKVISPDLVMKKMLYQMTVKFDPFLLKLFNDVLGVYLAGTLVLLNSEELALILTNSEVDRSRPFVKIVGDKSGLLAQPIWADLSQAEHEHRKIVRRVDPERYNLDLKQFVLND